MANIIELDQTVSEILIEFCTITLFACEKVILFLKVNHIVFFTCFPSKREYKIQILVCL